ncbi:MAG: beta galactosidase jelly roll domain-containing protein [Marinifilaceae bacterium]
MKVNILKIVGCKLVLLIFILCFQTEKVQSENLKCLVNLKGYWQFSIGDDPEWGLLNYDDSGWEKVLVPSTWEDNGFEAYNGFAWYRKHFQIHTQLEREFLYLYMGYIDDVDEVYVNGVLVGASGDFPPLVITAYDVPRMYPIPKSLLHPSGENVIAVRVFDDYGGGGIVKGPVGLFLDREQELLEVDLSGYWDFEAGMPVDKGNLNRITYRPGKIFVPGFWEARGYSGYDGEARLTKEFRYPDQLKTYDQALVLGVIDDIDIVYLNGERLRLSDKAKGKRRFERGVNHMTFRIYDIPDDLLKKEGSNIVEVMVKDFTGPGGIYRGPIGITSREKAVQMLPRKHKDNRSVLEKIFDYWWD